MFARLFAVASLVVLAVAGPAPLALRDQCSSGTINCCNNVSQHKDIGNFFSKSIVDALVDVTGEVAWNCSPITAIGALNGNQCSSQTVCCSGNQFNGFIQTGCSPINL